MEKDLKIRKDLNDVVGSVGFRVTKSKFGIRADLIVSTKLLSDKKPVCLEVRCDYDLIKLIDLLKQTGIKNPVTRKEIKEEVFSGDDGEFVSRFVEIELSNGRVYKYFIKGKNVDVLDIVYNALKKQEQK